MSPPACIAIATALQLQAGGEALFACDLPAGRLCGEALVAGMPGTDYVAGGGVCTGLSGSRARGGLLLAVVAAVEQQLELLLLLVELHILGPLQWTPCAI